MKATEIQVKVIESIIGEILFWRDCNDIHSPTIDCDIDNLLRSELQETGLNESQCDKVLDSLQALCNTIREINPKIIPVKRKNFIQKFLHYFIKQYRDYLHI